MKNELLKYKILFVLLLIVVSLIFTVLYIQTINQEYTTIEKLALEQARASYNKDLAYRKWAAEIGGVYVKVNDSLQPNPYLNVHNREITSTEGETYTMVNPAYMTRMVHELAWEQYKMKGHITSLKAINPNNEPDKWEKKALEMFEHGKRDYYSIENDQGDTYLRYMGAMVTEKACLKCHGYQGNKVGDIRGGISVSVPLKGYELIYNAALLKHSTMFGVVFLFSVLLLFIAYRVISKEVKKRILIQQADLEYAKRHKKIIQSAIDGFIMVEKDGRIADVNQAYCDMTGYTRDVLLKMKMSELEYIENGKEVKEHFQKVKKQGRDHFESILKKKDGSLIDVEVSSLSEPSDSNKIVSFIKNITDRKNTENALKESEQRYRHLVDNIYDLVCELDENGVYTYLNNKYIDILGYSPEELISTQAVDLFHPDDIAASLQKYEKLKEDTKRSVDIWRVKHKNGEYRIIESKGAVYEGADGQKRTVVVSRDITEQKNIEKELKESEKKFRQLFENMNEAFALHKVIKDNKGNVIDYEFIDVNPKFEELTGLKKENLVGKSVLEAMPGTEKYWIERYGEVATTGEPLEYANYSQELNKYYHVKAYSPEKDYFAVTFSDITSQKEAENAIKESEEKYKQIFESTGTSNAVFDSKMRMVLQNSLSKKNLGARNNEMIGKTVKEVFGEASGLKVEERVKRVIQTGKGERFETKFELPSGTRWFRTAYEPMKENNKVVAIQTISQDITDRKLMEEALVKSEERFRKIIEYAPDAVYLHDFEGRIIATNNKACIDIGYTRDEIINMNVTDIEAAYVKVEDLQEVWRNIEENKSGLIEGQHKRKDGSIFPVEIHISRIYIAEKEHFIAFVHDLTNRVKAENALRESEKRYRRIIEGANDAIFIADTTDGLIVDANAKGEELIGLTRKEIIGMHHRELHPKEIEKDVKESFMKNSQSEKSIMHETFIQNISGVKIPVEISPARITFGDGKEYLIGFFRDISERKKADEKLKESEQRYRNIYNKTPVMLHSIDKDGKLINVSEYWLETMGYERDEVIGRNSTSFLTKESRTFAKNTAIPRLFKIGFTRNIPLQFIKKSGEKMNILLSAVTELDEKGKTSRALAVSIDVTELKRTEEKLKQAKNRIEESEKKFKSYTEHSPIAIYTTDAEGNCIYINEKWQKISGLSFEEAKGKGWEKALHPQDREDVASNWYKFIKSGGKWGFEYRFMDEKGKVTWVEGTAKAIYDGVQVIGYVGSNLDITERKIAEQKLIESEKKYRDLVETAQELIWKCDSHGNYIYLNKAWETTFGYKLEEMLGKSFGDFQVKEDFQKDMNTFTKLMEGGSIKDYETVHIAKDGTKKTLLFNAIHVTDDMGNVVGTQGTATDITHIKKYEEELLKEKNRAEESEIRFKALHNASFGGIAIHDKGVILEVNQGMADLMGYTVEELIGMNGLLLIAEHHRDLVLQNIQNAYEKPFEADGLTKNGDVFPMRLEAGEIPYKGKNVRTVEFRDISKQKEYEKELKRHRIELELLVKERTDELMASNKELRATNDELYKQRDELEQAITKLNEAQAQLVQAEKMASLGVLVAGVAHEINNPVNFINSSLTGLKSNLDYLLGFTDLYQQLSEDNIEVIREIKRRQKDASLSEVLDMFKRSIEIIEVGIERTTKIVKSLKSFARSDEKELSRYNVNENIDNTLLILYHQYKNQIEIIKEYGKLPMVVCYPGQINQVLMNILTNAIQAIRDKGFITITTKIVDNDSVSVSIEDTGTGISKKDLEHIFDPFYTTKEEGKGTGLGLSISYNIIKEHKGTIKVSSEEGRGSCFMVIIPIKHEISI